MQSAASRQRATAASPKTSLKSSSEAMASAPRELALRLDSAPTRLLRAQLIVIAALFAINAVMRTWNNLDVYQAENVIRILSLESESSIPAFYSSTVLLAASILLAAIARVALVEKSADRWHWVALAAIFLFLAVDEATQIHESTRHFVSRHTNAGGLLLLAWVIPWSFLTAAFVIAFIPFLRRLAHPYAVLFVLAGAVYVIGALGMEMLQGPVVERWGVQNWRKDLLPAVEELLEMVGAALFLYAVFSYLVNHLGFRRISVS
jgi:hypothetical protein